MPSSYTSLLGLVLPTTGDLNGTWGGVLNSSLTQLVEDGVAGYATASVTSADWTLSTTGGGVTNEARMAIIIPTGTPGASRNIYAPKLSKQYAVINGSDAAIVFCGGPGTPTTGVTLPTGTRAIVAWDTVAGDFKFISPLGTADGSVLNATNLTGSGTVSDTATGGAGLTPTNATNLTGSGTVSATTTGGAALTPNNAVSAITKTLLATHTSDGTNPVIFTGISAAYDTLLVEVLGAQPSSASFTLLALQVSTDNGASFYAGGSDYACQWGSGGLANTPIMAMSIGATAGAGYYMGAMVLYRFNKSSAPKGAAFDYLSTTNITNGANTARGVVQAAAALAAPINAVQFFTCNSATSPAAGGAIVAGAVFNLYAWTK